MKPLGFKAKAVHLGTDQKTATLTLVVRVNFNSPLLPY